MAITKLQYRQARKKRIRMRVKGTSERPRLAVFRSLKDISAQLIDDASGRTIAAASCKSAKAKPNMDGAKKVGTQLAAAAKAAGVSSAVFDRNGYQFHGLVAALATGAREGGLQF